MYKESKCLYRSYTDDHIQLDRTTIIILEAFCTSHFADKWHTSRAGAHSYSQQPVGIIFTTFMPDVVTKRSQISDGWLYHLVLEADYMGIRKVVSSLQIYMYTCTCDIRISGIAEEQSSMQISMQIHVGL